MAVDRLHLLAYLANILAPVWDMPPMDGSLLKKRVGPFYPELQSDVDRLVGMGLVEVVDLGHAVDEDNRWRVTGSFGLNRGLSAPVLDEAVVVGHPDASSPFLRELTYALSAIDLGMAERLPQTDATYADPMVSVGNVIDFAEWHTLNYSANAARHFLDFLPSGQGTAAELTHMYLQLAAERIAQRD